MWPHLLVHNLCRVVDYNTVMEDPTVSDITICTLCKSQLHVAKFLPCLHYFCLRCLEDLAPGGVPGAELTCPTCEETFNIPDGGLSALPANSFVNNLLRMKKVVGSGEDLACSVCAAGAAKPVSATSYCLDCQQNMCQNCSSYHTRFAGTKKHKVIPRGLEEETLVRLEVVDWCDVHENRRQELFCWDCGLTICISCYTERHNSHTCSDIGAVADEQRELMRETVKEMDRLTVNVDSDERDLHRARDVILDQVTEAEFAVLKRREELMSCVQRDTDELMHDLQYFRDFVTSEFDTTSEKIRKRWDKINSFKQFARELINERSASVVANVASILKQRASYIRLQGQKSSVGKRPSVEVTFQPLGLCRLSQAKNKRKINLIGRICASITPSEIPQFRSQSMPIVSLPSEATSINPRPVFNFGSPPSSVTPLSQNRRPGRLYKLRTKAGHVLRRSATSSRIDYMLCQQAQQLNRDSDISSSSDEDTVYNGDENAVCSLAAAAVMQDSATGQETSLHSTEDFSSSPSAVLFSHKTKLRRFVNGSWCTFAVGNLEVLKLEQINANYLSMQNEKVCYRVIVGLFLQCFHADKNAIWLVTCESRYTAVVRLSHRSYTL